MDLDVTRQKIDAIDADLVALLEERMQLVNDVVAYKKTVGKPILDTSREHAVLQKVADRVQEKAFEDTIVNTFSDIMKRSRDYQATQID
ncbi:chorismate mutase [Streptococcus alactolyticus]|uniref:Chorismate mutase n=2 Tax=Streptococcus TaxID=1301 RepID=A0A6N7X075_STRAY|nr:MULTISPECIES: chorismate mutase [Streptococcus]MDE2586725.1 chorismate mutase [Lactobacillales bacterium]NKN84954.1 chorismate mutase [Streptococcus agalactiae]HIZ68114.1 chorismate mutase [Candidatus Streptococcus faecavium]MBD9119643.1 chorismate mutase [Streptococcus sp.]MCF2665407.1 chorismate mutase [Streptococcus alactolyticus]